MSLRAFLNAILAFIGSESLTDEEYALVNTLAQEYTKATYDGLRVVIVSRESVSTQAPKLKRYFEAKGVDLSSTPARIPSTQILVGGVLE